MLLYVPGAKSSEECPAIVTRPTLVGCLNWRWLLLTRTSRQPSASINLIASRTLGTGSAHVRPDCAMRRAQAIVGKMARENVTRADRPLHSPDFLRKSAERSDGGREIHALAKTAKFRRNFAENGFGESGSPGARFQEAQCLQQFPAHLSQPQRFSVFQALPAFSSVCRHLPIFPILIPEKSIQPKRTAIRITSGEVGAMYHFTKQG